MNPAFAGTLDLRIDGTGSLSRGISPFFVWFFGKRSRGCALCHLKRLGKEDSNLLKWLILLAVFTIDIATRPAITAQMLRKTASSPFVRRLAGLFWPPHISTAAAGGIAPPAHRDLESANPPTL